MSIHPSLKRTNTMKRHRSVLSRLERVRILHDRGSLRMGESSVLGLPKVKHQKMRVKKEKAAAPAPGTAAAGAASSSAAAPAGVAAPAAGAKSATGAKPAAGSKPPAKAAGQKKE